MKHLVAVPVENDQLCQHFGHCKQFAIIETDNDSVVREERVTPPPHEPGLLPKWLAERGVTDIIAGGMGQRAVSLFTEQNIRVNVGAQAKAPKELVAEWLKDSLVTGTNTCDH